MKIIFLASIQFSLKKIDVRSDCYFNHIQIYVFIPEKFLSLAFSLTKFLVKLYIFSLIHWQIYTF